MHENTHLESFCINKMYYGNRIQTVEIIIIYINMCRRIIVHDRSCLAESNYIIFSFYDIYIKKIDSVYERGFKYCSKSCTLVSFIPYCNILKTLICRTMTISCISFGFSVERVLNLIHKAFSIISYFNLLCVLKF